MLHFVAPCVAPWIATLYKRASRCSTVAPCAPWKAPCSLRQPVELPRAGERVRIGAGGPGDVGEVAGDVWRSLQNIGRVGPAQDELAPGPDDAKGRARERQLVGPGRPRHQQARRIARHRDELGGPAANAAA